MPRHALGLLGLFVFVVAGCGESAPVKVSKKLVEYNAPDGSFAILYPDGWAIEGNKGPSSAWAKFTSGSAVISVRSDPRASLLDDARGGRNADNSAPSPELAPVHEIHAMALDGAPDEYGSYQETAAGIQELDCPLGPARFSEFTGTVTMGGEVHGLRATAIGSKRGVHVVCVCAEEDWRKIRGAYGRVIRSVKRGQEQ
jgi:hypothetical protein